MAYSFKQRADKGFDFFKDNQKTTIEDYVKNTGANRDSLTTMMAQRGDSVSQQAMRNSKLPAQFNPMAQPKFATTTPKFSQPATIVKPKPETYNPLGDFVGNYLNPFGERGLFGKKNIAESTKVIQDTGDAIRGATDRFIGGEANGVLDDPRDIARFVANIPVGMVQSVLEAPKDVREAATGERLNVDNGKYVGDTKLTDLQRVGAAGNALINTAGLAVGGSATLLKSVFGNTSKEVTESMLKKVFTDALKEGGEEAVQSLFTDLQVTGGFDDETLGRAVQGFGLGAAAGGVLSGAGRAIDYAKNNTYSGKQASLARQLDESPVGSPQRQAIIAQMAENTKAKRAGEAGFIELGRTPKKIHPDDIGEMSDFIDYARGIYKVSPQEALKLETEASRLAERYGIDTSKAKTIKQLANVLDKRLQIEASKNKPSLADKVKKSLTGFENGSIRAGSFDPTGKLGRETPKIDPEIARVADNIEKNNPGFGRTNAEAMAKDVITNRQLNSSPQVTKTGSYYHETDPVNAMKLAQGIISKKGLNIASDEGLALGQGGKGAVVEFTQDGFQTRPIKKPGTGFTGQKEFTVLNDATSPSSVKSITFKTAEAEKAVNNRMLQKLIRINGFERTVLDDGIIRYSKFPAPQATKTPTMTKELKTAVDNIIADRNPELRDVPSDTRAKTKFTQGVKASQEVSSPLKKLVRNQKYDATTNEAQTLESQKYIKKVGTNKATVEIKERLQAKNIDAQVVSDAIELAKQLDAKGNPKNLQVATEIYEQLGIKLSEAGQTVQAASLLSNRTPEGAKYQAINVLRKAGVEMTPEIKSKIDGFKNDIKAQKPGSYEDGLARFKLMEYVTKKVPSSNVSKAVQLWKAGLLTSPRTTAGNLAANTAEAVLRKGYVDPLATMVDKVFSLFTGERSKSYTFRGMPSGAAEGVTKGIQYFKTGYDPRNPLTKFDIKSIHFSDKPLGKAAEAYTQTVFRLMGSQDQPFYYAALRNSLYDQALTNAHNQKLSGDEKSSYIKKFVTEPDKASMELADAEARYAVFQDETMLGDVVKRAKSSKAGDAVEFIVPFSGVPSSIATRMIMRTPIGIAHEIVKQVKSGNFDQRSMSTAIANGSMAIPLLGAGYALATAGAMTLGYPTDKDERDLWEAEGKQPYSIKVKNQTTGKEEWLSTNYFQPAGNLLAAGAEYAGAIKEGKTPDEALQQALGGAGKAFTEQSFLKGISGATQALSDPARSAEKFTEQTAGSIVPNLIRANARAFDPYQREQDNPVDAIKAGIPGLRETLDVRTNLKGEPVERRSSIVNELFNPFKPSDVKNADDPLIKELRRLQDAGQGITPSQAKASSIDVDEKTLRGINQRVSSEVSSEYNKVMSDPRYDKLNDEDKKRILEKVNSTVYGAIKSEYTQSDLNKLQQLYKKGADFDYFANFDMSSTTGDKLGTKLSTKSPSYSFLLDSTTVDSTDKAKWLREPVAQEYKTLVDNVNSILPKDLPKLPATNKIAELYATFEKDKTDNNWSELQTKKETKKLLTSAYKSQLSDNEQFISTLSDTEILAAAKNGEVSREEIDNIIKVDNILNKLGMSATIGNKARYALGYGTLSSSSGSTKKFSMPASDSALTTSLSTYNNLLKLLSSTSGNKATAQKVALKEYKIKGA